MTKQRATFPLFKMDLRLGRELRSYDLCQFKNGAPRVCSIPCSPRTGSNCDLSRASPAGSNSTCCCVFTRSHVFWCLQGLWHRILCSLSHLAEKQLFSVAPIGKKWQQPMEMSSSNRKSSVRKWMDSVFYWITPISTCTIPRQQARFF